MNKQKKKNNVFSRQFKSNDIHSEDVLFCFAFLFVICSTDCSKWSIIFIYRNKYKMFSSNLDDEFSITSEITENGLLHGHFLQYKIYDRVRILKMSLTWLDLYQR